MSAPPPDTGTPARPEFLLTAAEAYPVFERRVLAARDRIVMGFRVFDPMTRLRSAEARDLGETWIDLLVDALRRGVRIELHLSDFDPVAAADLHQACWRSVRILCGIRELAGTEAGQRLTVRPALHPAKIGRLARVLFWPIVARKIRQLERDEREGTQGSTPRRLFKYLPGVAYLRERHKGRPILSFPASHHQKLAVFDGRWVYIGGLDLDERRWDDADHDRPAQDTWHDVQALLDDPATAASAERHLQSFDTTAAGTGAPADTPGLLRTLSRDQGQSRPWSLSPRPVVQEIRDAHLHAIAGAERLIYLETQFFRDRTLARALARRARQKPGLQLILILPGAPETVAFRKRPALDGRYGDFLQARCLKRIGAAFGDRLLVASPVQPRRVSAEDMDAHRARLFGAPLIYVHAKVSVFDDRMALVSSANLMGPIIGI